LHDYRVENAIFHWYLGPLKLIPEIEKAGFYFSVNAAMIRSNAGKKIISTISRNHVLTESDGPFTEQGGRSGKSEDVKLVLVYLAKIWDTEVYTVESIIKENFQKLIGRIK
jgi:TatD DNase family protein